LIDQEKIHNQCLSDDPNERKMALNQLKLFLLSMPDNQQAWNDLHRLTSDEDSDVRSRVALSLEFLFAHVPFSQVPNKQQAWDDLHRLTIDKEINVRNIATLTLMYAFSAVPDKQQAWDDLHRLSNDEMWIVRDNAASALESAFSEIPDKQQAWNDILRLTTDDNFSVRSRATSALGSAFLHVPNKQQAWNDLHRLTSHEDSSVRTTANHSLGKVSIFKASQAETDEDYKKELEKAIEFFEISATESSSYNPARFCLPFYRSFHTIIFKKQETKEEVNKYLEEAKAAIKDSESKKQLFEAVKNLSEALKEVHNLENKDLLVMKGELNLYRKYCDHAAELMRDTDEMAPFATEVLRKGLPILDRNLKGLIEEIQEKARTAYKESTGTNVEETARAVCKEVQKWEIGSQVEMASNMENLIFTLESNIPKTPENQSIFNRIQQIREQKDVSKQYGIISTIIPLIPKLCLEQKVEKLKNDIKELNKKVDYVIISLKPGLKQEIEISSGIEIWGTGAKLITTVPLQEVSYAEIKGDLQQIEGKHINKLSEFPKRLASRIKDYLLKNDREDIVEQLT
jgi:HEAT repeat protein